jgi:hypothetical protein
MNNIISFERAQSTKKHNNCKHYRLFIDENYLCSCKDCGAGIDPAKWIYDRAKEQDNLPWEITELQRKAEKIKNKLRTQCVHCRKMTPIRIS